jgi:hypothetical protein
LVGTPRCGVRRDLKRFGQHRGQRSAPSYHLVGIMPYEIAQKFSGLCQGRPPALQFDRRAGLRSCREFGFERAFFLESAYAEHAETDDTALAVHVLLTASLFVGRMKADASEKVTSR